MHLRPTIAILVAVALVTFPTLGAAQVEENLAAYTEANASGYLEPLRDTLSSGLGAGLFNSAEIPSARPYFQLGARVMLVSFSDADRTFQAQPEDYFPGTGTFEAPTIIGETNPDPTPGPGGTSYQFPGGLDLDRLPVAAPQLVVGGVLGTEVMIRWFDGEFGDTDLGKISLWGLGARHSISQYLPNLPVALSAGFMYQSFEIGDGLIDFSQTTLGVQASKRFPIVEPYAGLSMHFSSMDSEYEYAAGSVAETLSVEFDSQTSVQAIVGATLNLFVLKLNGEIGLGDQTTFTLGLSLGL